MSTNGQQANSGEADILEILERVMSGKVTINVKDHLSPQPVGEDEEVMGDLVDHPKLLGLYLEMSRMSFNLEAQHEEHVRTCHAEGAAHSHEECAAFHDRIRSSIKVIELLKALFFFAADKQFGSQNTSSGVRDGTKFVRTKPKIKTGGSLWNAIEELLGGMTGVEVHHVSLGGAPSPSEGRRTIKIRRPGESGPN